jgi:hypothetical protein
LEETGASGPTPYPLSRPAINLFSVSDGFGPDVFILIWRIDDPVSADAHRKFALQIAEELLPDQRV